MTEINIEKDGIKGSIVWDEKNPADFHVNFGSDEIRSEIIKHFETPRNFYIQESGLLNDTTINFPVENNTFFELTLNTLMANTEVKVL